MPGFWEGASAGLGPGLNLAQALRAEALKRDEMGQQKAQFDAEMALKNKMLSMKGGNGAPKLKPGERYNQETDTVEQIPGSDLYNVNALKHEKDLQSLKATEAAAQMASRKVGDILSDPKNIESQFGGYNAVIGQYLPWNADARQKIESLKSNLKAQGLQLMKGGGGIGAISEKEWPIMEGMIEKLSPTMSEESARLALQEIQAKFEQLKNNADETYKTTWGGSQYENPKRAHLPWAGAETQTAKPDDFSSLWGD